MIFILPGILHILVSIIKEHMHSSDLQFEHIPVIAQGVFFGIFNNGLIETRWAFVGAA